MRERQENRPYFQLYLRSTGDDASADRGERSLRLRRVRGRTCAMVLEILCIPLGRSGNPDDCYLLYEDREEFDAAVKLAAMLDIPPISDPASPVAPEEAFGAGLGFFYGILERGVTVDRPLIDAAERRLAEALQSTQLLSQQRWIAGLLASRLMADFRYDDSAARSYAAQAERLAAPDSLEQWTAMFWRAEALSQEGHSSEAALLYQKIVEGYGPRVIHSQLIHQAKAGVRGKRKR